MDLCKTQKYQYFFPPLAQRRRVTQTFVISCNKVTLESAVGWFAKFCAPPWRCHRQTSEGLCHCRVTVLSFGSEHSLLSICSLPSVSLWRQTVTFKSQVSNLGKKSDVLLPSKSVLTEIKREVQIYILTKAKVIQRYLWRQINIWNVKIPRWAHKQELALFHHHLYLYDGEKK